MHAKRKKLYIKCKNIVIGFECLGGVSSSSKNKLKNFLREDFIFTSSHFEKVNFLYCYMFLIRGNTAYVNKIANFYDSKSYDTKVEEGRNS